MVLVDCVALLVVPVKESVDVVGGSVNAEVRVPSALVIELNIEETSLRGSVVEPVWSNVLSKEETKSLVVVAVLPVGSVLCDISGLST